jgi:hypothetical protein
MTTNPTDRDESLLQRTDGFDVVLGNPRSERIKLQEQEFFAAREPEIAEAPNAAARAKPTRSISNLLLQTASCSIVTRTFGSLSRPRRATAFEQFRVSRRA